MSDQPQITEAQIMEIDARISELTAQRNAAMDRCVLLVGTVTMMKRTIDEMTEQIKKLSPEKLADQE